MSDKRNMAKVASDLSSALALLADAQDRFEERRAETEAASRAETTAVNALNEAQKRVDALFEELRKLGGGDWAYERRHRRPAAPARDGRQKPDGGQP